MSNRISGSTPVVTTPTVATSRFATSTPMSGPTGLVQVGTQAYVVTKGQVYKDGEHVGTLSDSGHFSLRASDGSTTSGQLNDVPGVVFSGVLSTGEEVNNRPSGVVQLGQDTYEVVQGNVFHDGQHVGTLNDRGEYDVANPTTGARSAGHLAKLEGAAIAGQTSDGHVVDNRPSGIVRLGLDTFAVLLGNVFHDGELVGTINDQGDFRVQHDGREQRGNVNTTPGAVYSGALSDGRFVENGPSALVEVGGERYCVLEGDVFHDGELVGTVSDSGEYRIVDAAGDFHSGRLDDVKDARLAAQLSNGLYVTRGFKP